ncbi:galectin-4 isoform X4 [Plutella xylostella]|uniref:galectin-4 isoform X4 n=1 Tax=Plutella xylostella TaxID=51655 RepID=UPI002032190B|nr:galectin-4 isoform X4 [Plutella xylostella]
MASQPIFNPVIPCVQPIPGGAYPGLMIRIRGSSFPNAERFAINLQCGPNTDPRDDIALHLNVRYDHMCIVRNHLASMSWGPEDVDGAMPIARGQAFEALVLVEPSSFKVAFNGVHFCQFSHRLPFQRVSHLTIDGDVSVQSIGFEGAAPPPQYAPPQQQGYYGAPQQPGAYGGGQNEKEESINENEPPPSPPEPEPTTQQPKSDPEKQQQFALLTSPSQGLQQPLKTVAVNSCMAPRMDFGCAPSYCQQPNPMSGMVEMCCGPCIFCCNCLMSLCSSCMASCMSCFTYQRCY